MRFTLALLTSALAVSAAPWGTPAPAEPTCDKGCKINGISVGDCTDLSLTNVLNNLGVGLLNKRTGTWGEAPPPQHDSCDTSDKSCKINGISILDCSDLSVGDILNDLGLGLLNKRTWGHPEPTHPEQCDNGCRINGVSIADCTDISIGDILNDLGLGLLNKRTWGQPEPTQPSGCTNGCKINGISIGDCTDLSLGNILNGLSLNLL